VDSNDLKDAAVEALNLLSVGVVLIQGDGQVLSANRVAQRILERGDGLSCGGGRLQAFYSHEQAALTRTIAAAVADLPAGSVLTFARPSGGRALSVVVRVLRPEGADGGQPRLTAVFITDPDQEVAAEAQTFTSLYGLTPAEARLASSLVRGMSPAQAAAALGLTINTVRTHLKHIFSKTETRRQSDLVRVLLTGPAPLRAA
jgi:DNA-binding CsgD family transcriptional regulator